MKFETGKTYAMRFICDADAICPCVIVGRTAKTVRVSVQGSVKSCRISMEDGAEMCSPLGKYSMSPVLRANRLVA